MGTPFKTYMVVCSRLTILRLRGGHLYLLLLQYWGCSGSRSSQDVLKALRCLL